METKITLNRTTGTAHMRTLDPVMAERWQRIGWPVRVLGCFLNGTPRRWQCVVPWRAAVRFGHPPSGGH